MNLQYSKYKIIRHRTRSWSSYEKKRKKTFYERGYGHNHRLLQKTYYFSILIHKTLWSDKLLENSLPGMDRPSSRYSRTDWLRNPVGISAGCSGSGTSRSCLGSCLLNSIADDARFRARFSRTDSLDSERKK